MSNSASCRECMGTGGIGRLETCSECKGTGKSSVPVIKSPPVAEITYTGYEPSNSIHWLNKGLGYMEPGTKLYAEPTYIEISRHSKRLVEQQQNELLELKAAIAQQAAEIERLKEVTNFKDAVACVFDYLKVVAANTSSLEWDDELEELAEEVIEFAPEYKKEWRDICELQGKNRELTNSLNKAIDMLYETSMARSRIEQILIK